VNGNLKLYQNILSRYNIDYYYAKDIFVNFSIIYNQPDILKFLLIDTEENFRIRRDTINYIASTGHNEAIEEYLCCRPNEKLLIKLINTCSIEHNIKDAKKYILMCRDIINTLFEKGRDFRIIPDSCDIPVLPNDNEILTIKYKISQIALVERQSLSNFVKLNNCDKLSIYELHILALLKMVDINLLRDEDIKILLNPKYQTLYKKEHTDLCIKLLNYGVKITMKESHHALVLLLISLQMEKDPTFLISYLNL
jgi:hypothetical protein